MKFILLIIVGLFVLAILALGVVWVARRVLDFRKDRKAYKELENQASASLHKVLIAERYLRTIANGAGNPVFEAQEALDILNPPYNEKELN